MQLKSESFEPSTLAADALIIPLTSTQIEEKPWETRVIATDATARAKFRRYWSLVSPGIIAIRWVMLQPVKREAEREALCLRSR